jgi:hypothetical protein
MDDDECGAFGGNHGRVNCTGRKPAPVLCTPQIPRDLTRARWLTA